MTKQTDRMKGGTNGYHGCQLKFAPAMPCTSATEFPFLPCEGWVDALTSCQLKSSLLQQCRALLQLTCLGVLHSIVDPNEVAQISHLL